MSLVDRKEVVMKIITNETEKFEIVMGVVAGYFHNNEGDISISFGKKLQQLQAEVMSDTGLYVSAIWRPAMVSYSTDWGCPAGGEKVYKITGTRNPAFAQDAGKYREAVELLCTKLMETFHQSTATLEWQKTELNYLQS